MISLMRREPPVATLRVTVTRTAAFTPEPSWASAVMVAVPRPTPVMLPSWSTVATFSLPEVQVSFFTSAFSGSTVAWQLMVSPITSSLFSGVSWMLLTGMSSPYISSLKLSKSVQLEYSAS